MEVVEEKVEKRKHLNSRVVWQDIQQQELVATFFANSWREGEQVPSNLEVDPLSTLRQSKKYVCLKKGLDGCTSEGCGRIDALAKHYRNVHQIHGGSDYPCQKLQDRFLNPDHPEFVHIIPMEMDADIKLEEESSTDKEEWSDPHFYIKEEAEVMDDTPIVEVEVIRDTPIVEAEVIDDTHMDAWAKHWKIQCAINAKHCEDDSDSGGIGDEDADHTEVGELEARSKKQHEDSTDTGGMEEEPNVHEIIAVDKDAIEEITPDEETIELNLNMATEDSTDTVGSDISNLVSPELSDLLEDHTEVGELEARSKKQHEDSTDAGGMEEIIAVNKDAIEEIAPVEENIELNLNMSFEDSTDTVGSDISNLVSPELSDLLEDLLGAETPDHSLPIWSSGPLFTPPSPICTKSCKISLPRAENVYWLSKDDRVKLNLSVSDNSESRTYAHFSDSDSTDSDSASDDEHGRAALVHQLEKKDKLLVKSLFGPTKKFVGVKECKQLGELNPKFKNLWIRVVNSKVQLPSSSKKSPNERAANMITMALLGKGEREQVPGWVEEAFASKLLVKMEAGETVTKKLIISLLDSENIFNEAWQYMLLRNKDQNTAASTVRQFLKKFIQKPKPNRKMSKRNRS